MLLNIDCIKIGEQSFYREHTDDIISLAINHNPKFKNIVATGQIGVDPEIHVWDAMSKQTLSTLKGFHKIGISALNFSCTGKFLVSLGVDSQFSLAIWRWQDGKKKLENYFLKLFYG